MELLFDAGNTRLKWALVDSNDRIVEQGGVFYQNLKEDSFYSIKSSELSRVYVSSVAGEEKNDLISSLSEKVFGVQPKYARVKGSALGMANHYRDIDRLGVDRWVAAMGVVGRVGINRIIVDAGTAVTIDAVSKKNEFLGGVILPGRDLMHRSLTGQTAEISSEKINVHSVIGQITDECVNAGIQYGLTGAVSSILDEMDENLSNGGSCEIVVCGGDGQWLFSNIQTSLKITLEPNLIFQGLINLKNGGEV